MLVDIALKVTPKMTKDAQGNLKKAMTGHLGTHFDVMNQEFPLEFVRRQAVVFDVSAVSGRDVAISDIDIDLVERDMFVAFHTGYIDKVEYGSEEYFASHPALSVELIDALLDKGISIIGVAFGAGMGCLEASCGALAGAQMLMGKRYQGKPLLRDAAGVLHQFGTMCKATICKDLKGMDTGVVLCECDDCVRNAVEIVEGMSV